MEYEMEAACTLLAYVPKDDIARLINFDAGGDGSISFYVRYSKRFPSHCG